MDNIPSYMNRETKTQISNAGDTTEILPTRYIHPIGNRPRKYRYAKKNIDLIFNLNSLKAYSEMIEQQPDSLFIKRYCKYPNLHIPNKKGDNPLDFIKEGHFKTATTKTGLKHMQSWSYTLNMRIGIFTHAIEDIAKFTMLNKWMAILKVKMVLIKNYNLVEHNKRFKKTEHNNIRHNYKKQIDTLDNALIECETILGMRD